MGLFDDVLKEGESLVKNEHALDYEFLPKILPHREQEQRYLASCVKPLFQGRAGRNVLVHGAPGIGKTAAARAVLRELEQTTEDIGVDVDFDLVYLNCWQQNTTYKVLVEVAEQLGFRFTQNKNTTELMKVIERLANKGGAVFVFDEIDKAEDFDFLYSLIEQVHKKSIILITNYKSWLLELDERIKSRLMPEQLEFKQYSAAETKDILKQRLEYAFVPGAMDDAALSFLVEKAAAAKDIRSGLFMMKQAAVVAESKAAKKITKEHIDEAIKRMGDFTIKKKDELDEEVQFIFDIVKKNTGKKIGDLFRVYQKEGGKASYKTFQRKIAYLDESKFVSLERQTGEGGNTTIVNRKITDF